ncbi:MAG TPA: hypothetical protein VM344_02785 [Vitreimonas sp.]|nr:hypothetical protein [Vitreimonas sp.]
MSPRPDEPARVLDRAVLETEVGRIVDGLAEGGVPIRVLGSLGVSLHCPDSVSLLSAFERTYADIDFVGYGRDAAAISSFLAALGYVQDRELWIASEGRRAVYDHPSSAIHLDVFYDRLEFCHTIPIAGRLERDRPTLPVAELALSKLQIFRINEKDVVDVILLLLDHDIGDGDADTIDGDRVAALCAGDWGLWRTVTMNLDKVRAMAAGYPQLDEPKRARVAAQVTALLDRLDREPKPLAWRARARVGDRVRWWTEVEDVR